MANKLVDCEWCGTRTFSHMLDWHKGRCPNKPSENGAEPHHDAAPAEQPSETQEVRVPETVPEPIVPAPLDEVVEQAVTLEQQEQLLLEQLAAIRAKREEEKRQAELARQIAAQKAALEEERKRAEKPLKITVLGVLWQGSHVLITNTYRDDFLAVLQSIEDRRYQGDGKNAIPFVKWPEFLDKIGELKNVSVTYAAGTKKQIEDLNAPPWLVDVDSKFYLLKQGPKTNAYIIHSIPGQKFDRVRDKFLIPLTEGWRIAQVFKGIDGVVYTDAAHDAIVKQIEQRAQIDKIALMEDAPEMIDALCQVVEIDGVKKTLGEHLRAFQRVGIKFIDTANGRALLADEMGLGKTWQGIGYAELKKYKRVLVVCPASLKANWTREIKKLTGINASVLSGGEPSQHDMIKMVAEPPRYAVINYDILARKTDHVKRWEDAAGFTHEEEQERFFWVELCNMYRPELILVDEGHYIKNKDSNRSKAVRLLKAMDILFMTGTPVLNRAGELWPMLTMIAPETFPAHETFIHQYTYNGKETRNVEELRQALRGIMIRRLKKDVVAELPPINRIQEFVELSAKAQKLYKKIEQGVYEQVAEYNPSGTGGNTMSITSILAQIMRLKQVCSIDKVDRTAELALDLYDQTDESEARKVIIFSQFKPVAYAISQRLGSEGVLSFVERTQQGWHTVDNAARDRLVQQFQSDPSIKYLVATEKTMKEGLNATKAGHVIFNDLFWTPAAHEQAEARAYGRLSDLHSINSYYLIADMGGESIEEWIMQLLASKLKVINEVVEGVEDGRGDESIAMALIEKLRANMWRK